MPPCPLCQQPMRPWLTVPKDWRRPDVDLPHELFWCDRDGYGMIAPRPGAEVIASYYAIRDYYTHQQEDPAAPASAPPTFQERLRTHLAWRTDRSEPLTAEGIHQLLNSAASVICDVGCGNGNLLAELKALGHSVQGVEPDPAARAAAEAQGVPVLPGTAEALPAGLPMGQCDVVILSHVLEHCLDPLHALDEVKALLKPGGMLLCEVPNNAATGLRQSGITWYWLDVPRHLNFFTSQSLAAACVRAGFEVDAMHYTGYTRQFSRDWIEAERHIAATFSTRHANPWRLLARTLLASPDTKYDSLRIHARPVG